MSRLSAPIGACSIGCVVRCRRYGSTDIQGTEMGMPAMHKPTAPPPGKAAVGNGSSPHLDADEYSDEEDQATPPPAPEPKDPGAPRFSEWPQQRSFMQVVMDKAGDTVQDLLLIMRRTLLPSPSRSRLRALVRKSRSVAARARGGDEAAETPTLLRAKKPIVLVLGSGWAAHALIKVIDVERYEVVLVSPRNHFMFTPMLPSTAVGTVEFRSLCEPIRVSNRFVEYVGATCEELDVERKTALCVSSVAYQGGRKPHFQINYDLVVVAVGEQSATFGVPGVAKYGFFIKEISDTIALRKRVQDCFELAALPGTPEADIRRALHFIVVGGGPTGVEFAGTLADFVRVDLRRKYPELMPFVRVTLLQSAQSILTMFDERLQRQALASFEKAGVEVRTGVRVVEVTQDQVVLPSDERLDYGVCVWSTGNASRPLVQAVAAQLPAQAEFSGGRPAATKLAVDPFLRIVGARDALALGDCAMMHGNRLPATAQVAGQQGAYAARMINRMFRLGCGGLTEPFPSRRVARARGLFASVSESVSESMDEGAAREYFRKPFEFLSLGLLAYIGNNQALTQVDPIALRLSGYFAFLVWRSVYITKQVSFRNRVLILFDWVKTRAFGRDLSSF
ncbi:hypothetical protein WJX81_003133 [Elliptochloris bilobata]|uniref:NADH:ubiquinone reductase (non-electrogenic) n=1 Tax=Elliptochloris bilobata TaxID=381761 RepID=A0AAW1SCU4_9CHLO